MVTGSGSGSVSGLEQSPRVLDPVAETTTLEMESLLRVARAVNSTLELGQLVRVILEELREVVEYSAASLILVDGDELVVHDLVGPESAPKASQPGARFPLTADLNSWPRPSTSPTTLDYPCVQVATSPLFWEEMHQNQCLIIPDILETEGEPAESYRRRMGDRITTAEFAFMRTWMAVPLTAREHLIGYIGIASSEARYFKQKHARLAQAFAAHAAIAIENARLYERAQELAVHEERQRLARDLHDSVAQVFYGIALGAQTARKYLERNPQAAADPIDYTVALAGAGLAEMRALIFDLDPGSLEAEGLVAAINRQVLVMQSRHGIAVDPLNGPEPEAPLKVKEAIYRIIREAMHNVVKHARARQVRLSLAASPMEISFEIDDDGVGFAPDDVSPGHLGLRSMRDRAQKLGGELSVSTGAQRGTRVSGSIPLDAFSSA